METFFFLFQLEFFEAGAHGCVFTAIYGFAIELLNAKHRVFGYVLMVVGGSVGNLLFGIVVMFVHDFRVVLRIINAPGMLVFLYFWFIPESTRWLLATGRVDRAISTMKRIAKFNRCKLSEKKIESIKLDHLARKKSNENEQNQSVLALLWTVLKTRTLCLRFLNNCLQWVLVCLSYYGVYQFSTQVPGTNRYVSYLIMISTEGPMNLLIQFTFNRLKRRITLSSTFFVGGLLIMATSLIPKDQAWTVVLCFLISKSLIGFAFSGLVLYTGEQFPTNIRQSILNTSSMMGRLGSMTAPYIVILVSVSSQMIFIPFLSSTIFVFISFHHREANMPLFRHYYSAGQPF